MAEAPGVFAQITDGQVVFELDGETLIHRLDGFGVELPEASNGQASSFLKRGETQMGKRIWCCLGLALVTVLLLTACEGGFTASGTSHKSSIGMRNGWIEKRIKKADGSAVQEIEAEQPGRRLEATVTLEVGEGTFSIELLDREDNVTLTLEARPGHPATGSGYMVTNAFGEARYRVTAVEAKNVEYRIEFDIQ